MARARISREKGLFGWLGRIFLEKKACLDGWGACFSRKRLVWMAGACISRENGLSGWLGRVFLEKKAGLDGWGVKKGVARKDCQKGLPEGISRKDSQNG